MPHLTRHQVQLVSEAVGEAARANLFPERRAVLAELQKDLGAVLESMAIEDTLKVTRPRKEKAK